MPNVCKNCGDTVIPDPTDGHCPNCNAKKGYAISQSWTFRHRIEDERDEIKRTIDNKFKEYDEYITQGKNVEFYKKLKESLEKQIPDFLINVEKNTIERLKREEKEKSQHKISFTIGAIIGTEEQRKIKEQEDHITKLENEKEQLHGKLEAEKLFNEGIRKTIDDTALSVKTIKDRLSPKSTIVLSLLIGFIASLTASFAFTSLWP